MLPRERVLTALNFQQPDRVPIYIWIFGQPGVIDDIVAKYGTFEAFCDALDVDVTQAFPAKGFLKQGATPNSPDSDYEPAYGWVYTLDAALEAEFTDPDDPDIYTTIRAEIEHHKETRGRAVFVQTPGVFEAANGVIGQTQNLMEMAMRPEMCRRLYERIARWASRYAENCLDLGADVIHISDDWGMNHAMMFRPQTWWEVVYPAEKVICDAVRRKGGLLSLHSDGYITPVLDGVAELGFRVVHPVQESAGMDPVQVKRDFYGRLGIYGGLDVRTMLGRALPREQLAEEIRRVMHALKPGGGYIFCTSHMVQPGTPLEEVEFAYQVAHENAWYC